MALIKATPHKCNDTHCRIAILWKAIGLPRTFARKSALTQAARQGLSARIRFANANMMLNLAVISQQRAILLQTGLHAVHSPW